jgi:hypothetical protein
MRLAALIALAFALTVSSSAQQKTFDWVVASNEGVRLDPGFYHTGRVYRPGNDGGNIHVKIHSERPVTIAMTWITDWNEAKSSPEMASRIRWRCVREHVVDTMYECNLPPSDVPMVLTIRDERMGQGIVLAGVGTILKGGGVAARAFVSPNDVAITYHRWACVTNCIEPEFKWVRLVKEKYELTSIPKIYSLFVPEREGQQVSVKIKAPIPMTVAVLPSKLADQLYDKPGELSSILSNTTCKQRGVQSLTFECAVNPAEGQQSLFVWPESPRNVPRKKAEIEFQAVKCVANCELMTSE